ncbi:MAG: 4Fe-4S cluster-binding domain-containing protein [Actinobacteria bacterium]|nr:4Fe-4S cluster-binding domain-containing protein [Actinomycetota bacterium]
MSAAGPRRDRPVIISEIFGPTVQGEGPSLGRRCGFVRLGRCNLACSFCDTPFTWRWTDHDPAVELRDASVDEIVTRLDTMAVDMVVISGGEPLVQQRELKPLVDAVRVERRWRIEVETAGTIAPLLDVDQWNVSPKLANSGNPRDRRYKPDVLQALAATGRAVFKFVVVDPADLDEIASIVEDNGLTNVWLMPEGTDATTLAQRMAWVAPAAVDRGWNVTTRLHILIWGDERGR